MKNKLFIALIAFFSITLSRDSVAGYESTTKEERLSQLTGIDDAYLTSRQEERSRMEDVDDAFLTENQEEIERMTDFNDAHATSAVEQIEQN